MSERMSAGTPSVRSAVAQPDGPLPGPGLSGALDTLGSPGRHIRQVIEACPPGALPSVAEVDPAEAAVDGEARRFDESKLATRWLTYRRCGIACAFLRDAGHGG